MTIEPADGQAVEVEDLGPEDKLLGPTPITTPKEALKNTSRPTEVKTSDPLEDLASGEAPFKSLGHFLHNHVFLTFFGWVADKQHPSNQSPPTRFRHLRDDHKLFYWICLILDLIVLLIVIVLILTAIVITGYKTLWM